MYRKFYQMGSQLQTTGPRNVIFGAMRFHPLLLGLTLLTEPLMGNGRCPVVFRHLSGRTLSFSELAAELPPAKVRTLAASAPAEQPLIAAVVLFDTAGRKGPFSGNTLLKVHADGRIEFEVVDAVGTTVAQHSFRDAGKDFLYVEGTQVFSEGDQSRGINRAFFDLMLALRPETKLIKSSLTQDNERAYFNALNAGATPVDAAKSTAAYRIRSELFEINPESSQLPLVRGREIVLVLERQ